MSARVPTPTALVAMLLMLFAASCALIHRDGDSKKDAETPKQEDAAARAKEQKMEERGRPPESPVVELSPDGFGDSRLARVGDAFAEGLVLAALAGLVTGIVHLFKHRRSLLGLLVSGLALLLALLAFLKSWG